MKNILRLSLFIAIMFTSCSKDSEMASESSGDGAAGSLARFSVVGDFLYTVNNEGMKLFNLNDPSNPIFTSDIPMQFGIETIRSRGDSLLFIGSQNGMYIYDIKTASAPVLLSQYQHVVSCDPVVVDEDYAYVTLHSEGSNMRCNRNVNELQIIDISNLRNPYEVAIYPMEMPKGLGIDGNDLFVCDDGLKVFDATNSPEITLKHHFTSIVANDVIAYNGTLLVTAENGLFQYSYGNGEIKLLSKITACNDMN